MGPHPPHGFAEARNSQNYVVDLRQPLEGVPSSAIFAGLHNVDVIVSYALKWSHTKLTSLDCQNCSQGGGRLAHCPSDKASIATIAMNNLLSRTSPQGGTWTFGRTSQASGSFSFWDHPSFGRLPEGAPRPSPLPSPSIVHNCPRQQSATLEPTTPKRHRHKRSFVHNHQTHPIDHWRTVIDKSRSQLGCAQRFGSACKRTETLLRKMFNVEPHPTGSIPLPTQKW